MSSIQVIPRTGRIELEQRTGRIKKAERKIITARDTEATYFDKNGILQTGAPHEIRYSKNFETGKMELLLEDEATNLINYSDDFTKNIWAIRNIVFEQADIQSPFVDIVISKVTSNLQDRFYTWFRQEFYEKLILGQVYSTSALIKKGNVNLIGLRVAQTIDKEIATFNLETGEWFLVPEGIQVQAVSLPYDFYYIQVSQVAEQTAGFAEIILTKNGRENGAVDAGSYLYVAGVQFEKGYATSYIPTQGQPVTRAADKLVFDT